MMELRQLQREMQRGLLGEESTIETRIADAPPLAIEARLRIYRHAYVSRLIEVLQDHYPVLHQILGDEDFEALSAAFIRAHPSVHRSIRWYGRELAAFLRKEPPFDAQPILGEIAGFEWGLGEAFDSADASVLDRAALQAIDPAAWGRLKLRLHPSLRRLKFEWNTVAVWKAITAHEDPPDPERSDEPVEWLLWRRDLENYFRSLDGLEGAALTAALEGRKFEEICEILACACPEDQVPHRAATFIAGWADSKIIVELG
jgi:hypothetical protein